MMMENNGRVVELELKEFGLTERCRLSLGA